MSLTDPFLLLTVLFASLIVLLGWGFISAKMHARPWQMLVLGFAAIVIGAIQQFKLSLPVPVINNHSEAANILLEIREMLSVGVSAFLAMGGALMGSAVSLQASRLHAQESNEIQIALEDTELDLEELKARIAATPLSSKEDRDWLTHEFAEATERHRELEHRAEKFGLLRKHRKRRAAPRTVRDR